MLKKNTIEKLPKIKLNLFAILNVLSILNILMLKKNTIKKLRKIMFDECATLNVLSILIILMLKKLPFKIKFDFNVEN